MYIIGNQTLQEKKKHIVKLKNKIKYKIKMQKKKGREKKQSQFIITGSLSFDVSF